MRIEATVMEVIEWSLHEGEKRGEEIYFACLGAVNHQATKVRDEWSGRKDG